MTIYYYIIGEMKGSSYVKITLRSSANMTIENHDRSCFIWSTLEKLYPIFDPKNGHSTRVSYYRQYLSELNIQGFDFTNGFKCTDAHKFEKLSNLSINLIELSFYQDQKIWKHKLIPIEVSKNESDRVSDLLIYKSHYVLIEKLNVVLGNHNCNYVCKKCLNSYICQILVIKHEEKSEQKEEITTIRTSDESHLYWKNHFHKNHL